MAAASRTPKRGHPVRGAILGLLFGVFLTFDLLQMGVVPLASNLVVALPVVTLLLGFAFGRTAPLGFLCR